MTLDRLRRFIRRNIVDTVPAGLEACLDCGQVRCAGPTFATCPRRLARADYRASAASASRTTSSSAPAAKGDASPAEPTSAWKGALPPRPHSAT